MIYLTGANGFVGKNLSKYLTGLGFVVECLTSSKSQTYEIDKKAFVKKIINKPGVIIHLAGKAHDLKNISNPNEYYQINTDLTKQIFDTFLASSAKVFITLSSVKAVADNVLDKLTEDCIPNPITHYGKSKLLAEQYILSRNIPTEKRFYILRPCMIHGPENKGNLNLLYKFVSFGVPWPLGAFENKRSFCSIENLMFVINELIIREDIPSGVYNVADDKTLSTNDIISLIAKSQNRKPKIWNIPKSVVKKFAKIGDLINLPLNSERLEKLTQDYVVSNYKLKKVLNKEFPITSTNGMIKTLNSFNKI